MSEPKTATLNVLFVSHDGGMAGAQWMLLTLIRGVRHSGIRPILAVPFDGELADRARALDVDVEIVPLRHWVPCEQFGGILGRLKYLVKSFWMIIRNARQLKTVLRKKKIDAVYSNTVTVVEGGLAARMCGLPHLWHIHEPIYGNREVTPLLPRYLYSKLIGMLSTSVILPSRSLKDEYRFVPKDPEVIYNGIALPGIRNREICKKKVTSWLGITDDTRLVGVIGALQPRKDHENFILAAEQVLASRHDAVFIIVGTGEKVHADRLRAQIVSRQLDGKVILAGRWEGDIGDLLSALDILVVSSEQESFGLTIIEAMAVKTPVVSTRCGGPEEIIEHKVNGMLVAKKDPGALGRSIDELLSDRELSCGLIHRAAVDVRARFSEQRYISAVEKEILAAVKSIEDD